MAGQHLKFTKIFYYLSDITTSQRYFNLKLVSRHKKTDRQSPFNPEKHQEGPKIS